MSLSRLLPFIVALLLAVPAAQAELYQKPGPNSPAAKDQVELYAPKQDKVTGIVSIPDTKSSVLIQPEGREWRDFRTRLLRIGIGALIVAAIALLALFYLLRGPIKIKEGRSGRRVLRFNMLDRFAHWTTAVSFLVMALTGLVVTFGRPLLIPLIGHPAFTSLAEISKAAHNFFSVPFVVGMLMVLVLWVRDNIPDRSDITWLKNMGGLLSKKGAHPEAGRFNAGQKGIFWAIILGGGGLAVTGFMMLTPFALTGVGGMQITHVIHGVLAALLIAVIIAHIYIGTIGMEGAFDAMGHGDVDENWAKEHHALWYRSQVRKGYADSSRGVTRPAGE